MYFWVGRARHPGPPSLPRHFGVELLDVGGWLTHGDLALGAGVDFLAVVEHRLIPARVRSEWSRLRKKGFSSPVTLDDLSLNRGMGIGAFHQASSDVHRRLIDFIHRVVVHRRDEAIREWRN